jgi:uncharacterized protein
MMPKESVVKSPCISVCVLNDGDVCEGCFRTSDEITRWSQMTNEEKQNVLIKADGRFNELNTHLLL